MAAVARAVRPQTVRPPLYTSSSAVVHEVEGHMCDIRMGRDGAFKHNPVSGVSKKLDAGSIG